MLRKVGNELLEKYFPKTTSFLSRLNDFWYEKTEGKTVMEFGHFYTMAINFPIVHKVQTIPHTDGLNLSFGPCAIMPFGEFTSISRLTKSLSVHNK